MEATIGTGEIFYVTKTTHFNKNDIAVFNFYGPDYSKMVDPAEPIPMHWEKRFYRLMAVSGDTILVKDGDVFVNGKPAPAVQTILEEYEVLSTMTIDDFPEWGDAQTQYIQDSSGKGRYHYYVLLTTKEATDYRERKPAIISVTKALEKPFDDTLYAKNNPGDKWTSDQYGPLLIPSPSQKVVVNAANYKLYQNIPGIQPGENEIKEPLYFLMGDNRHRAQDSRYIGFISHSNMYGIVK